METVIQCLAELSSVISTTALKDGRDWFVLEVHSSDIVHTNASSCRKPSYKNPILEPYTSCVSIGNRTSRLDSDRIIPRPIDIWVNTDKPNLIREGHKRFSMREYHHSSGV